MVRIIPLTELPFTTYMDPTPKTRKIARMLLKHVRTKKDVLGVCTRWVYENIQYVPDALIHGKEEEFASPDKTLELGSGDCEDMSFLTVALVRSFPLRLQPEEIYVTVGYLKKPFNWLFNTSYHAWGFAKISKKQQYILEPTAGFILHYKHTKRYIPLLGIYPNKLVIFKKIGDVI